MRIRFLDVAQAEFDEAVAHYNQERPGLGNEFLTEVLKSLDRIARFPKAWRPLSKRTRRCQLRRFPYGIIYQQQDNDLVIVALAHLRRKPEYWKDHSKWL